MTPDGQKKQIGLENYVRDWGTPRVTTNGGHPSPQCTGKGSRLEDQAAMWQTPEAQNSTGYQNQKNGGKIERLGSQVLAWPTPNVGEANSPCKTSQRNLSTEAGRPVQENRSTDGKNCESWPTPHSSCNTGAGAQGRQGEREIKPGMGRAINGTQNRVDRLRLLGNGVVPATAEKAFLTLLNRIENPHRERPQIQIQMDLFPAASNYI